jgi:Phage terminase, small subunit
MQELNAKQQLFALKYIELGNGGKAAIAAGYSSNTADQQASRLLRNVKIKQMIDEQMKEVEKETIASAEEVLTFLTDVVRGDIGDTITVDGILEEKTRTSDRIKAAELLGKRHALFTDKKEISADVKVENKLGDILSELQDDEE